MSLPHALLTSLAERPGSGSELTRRFDRSIGYFWHATHQQIYRELARLEQRGWVESSPVEQARGRKRAYRILPAGREELKRWVAQHDDPKPQRDELLIRLRAEAAVGPTGLVDTVRQRLEQHRQKLALYREIEARDFAHDGQTKNRRLQHLVLQAGIMYERTQADLLQQALDILALPDERARPSDA
ncbi:PadR family transcriptional regulator [Burkholderia singularis]|uniref:PadR family transcriptional regulator n=1 Tax=Burkholderia singularis TaxID=1503053 RepID=A0A103DXJ6_9BURK|nr:PadR family transcriptional regulator [Burkholderia singularis]KVE24551.1 PadR family transcriptional regulator [Burkholderia singularis]SMG00750.1 Transcriptional regulator, PadR family [Burkholderia singularis]